MTHIIYFLNLQYSKSLASIVPPESINLSFYRGFATDDFQI